MQGVPCKHICCIHAGKRRRSAFDKRVSDIMTEFNVQTAESDKSFFDLEEKQMKLEMEMAERRRVWEEEQTLQMQQMFAQQMQQMMLMTTGYLPSFQQYSAHSPLQAPAFQQLPTLRPSQPPPPDPSGTCPSSRSS